MIIPKNNSMHTHHRTWHNIIMIGLAVLILAAVAVFVSENNVSPSDAPSVTAPSASEYEAAVRSVVGSYDTTRDASAAYDALVAMRVPSAYLSAHLDLVIAFASLATGKTEDGNARLSSVVATNSWISSSAP